MYVCFYMATFKPKIGVNMRRTSLYPYAIICIGDRARLAGMRGNVFSRLLQGNGWKSMLLNTRYPMFKDGKIVSILSVS